MYHLISTSQLVRFIHKLFFQQVCNVPLGSIPYSKRVKQFSPVLNKQVIRYRNKLYQILKYFIFDRIHLIIYSSQNCQTVKKYYNWYKTQFSNIFFFKSNCKLRYQSIQYTSMTPLIHFSLLLRSKFQSSVFYLIV